MKKHKIKAKQGNTVKIISGKYKGQTGIIKEVLNEKNKVIIQNINIQTKHVKVKQSEEKGSIKQIEGPIHYSNIKIV
uniref:Large ribosomal subunit protein uL24c n=1 Tax=Laurencia verruciformis TaxID=3073068 RepID=A0AA51NG04_9FLOR|nr:50S ribosomal protein L24 [Laurencia obtusa]WMP12313.1 50S ribosomal protein L24 [Laurencia verruciformis]WMP12957.1 50S ribosomal protein L24 [Laurencia obtusa]